jgi:hypothetical protein
MLSFPLGLFYLVILMTGYSLGIGLIITLIGIPLLFGMLLLGRIFASFERILATTLLTITIKRPAFKRPKRFWRMIEAYLRDALTWKSLAYLLVKFPMGILAFSISITLLTLSIAMISVPLMYVLSTMGAIGGLFCSGALVCSFLDSAGEVVLIGALGILLLIVTLHIHNGIARIYGLVTKQMLS